VGRTVGHVFTIALGILGWGVVFGLPAAGVLPEPEPTAALWIALFVIVILAARALAFRVEGSVLSLDSAYYVAAALSVGSVGAGRLVAVVLTLDASLRLYSARKAKRAEPAGWFAELGYVLYFGGMSGGRSAPTTSSSHVPRRAMWRSGSWRSRRCSWPATTRSRACGSGCSGAAGGPTCPSSRCPASSPRPR
jgi:hypothetical protein